MFQCNRVILKGRVEIGLRGMAGVARLREKGQIRQFQLPDHACHTFNQRGISLPLKSGMDEHQAQKQHTQAQQRQGKARFSDGKSSLCRFLSEESFSQAS
jgi:hypothetical protein